MQPQHFARKLNPILPARWAGRGPPKTIARGRTPTGVEPKEDALACLRRAALGEPGCGLSPTRSIVCCVPTRPLLLVAALAGGDYLLWTWSSDGGSATIALISGLALAPLILALIWLASVAVARLLLGRGATKQTTSRRPRPRRLIAGARRRPARSQPAAERWEQAEMEASASPGQSSEKLAA